ncbi:hypothetical protein B0T24DRAFT_396044 [Lasiosphaeria ovina]|uniref:Uncharacterized protein n=1 Tax=Lasiosphaeria ovina TaxID=92902 RepID=A0AAE0JX44_9PEZI|nr:hypothetical protein B0T24DRAFT_396044 [Lasiosphaeria ovina]
MTCRSFVHAGETSTPPKAQHRHRCPAPFLRGLDNPLIKLPSYGRPLLRGCELKPSTLNDAGEGNGRFSTEPGLSHVSQRHWEYWEAANNQRPSQNRSFARTPVAEHGTTSRTPLAPEVRLVPHLSPFSPLRLFVRLYQFRARRYIRLGVPLQPNLGIESMVPSSLTAFMASRVSRNPSTGYLCKWVTQALVTHSKMQHVFVLWRIYHANQMQLYSYLPSRASLWVLEDRSTRWPALQPCVLTAQPWDSCRLRVHHSVRGGERGKHTNHEQRCRRCQSCNLSAFMSPA